MGKPIDIAGQRFGRLVAIRPTGEATSAGRKWLCLCDCGKEVTPYASALRNGHSQSCGCRHKDIARAKWTTHGEFGTPTYRAWIAMRSRCEQPRNSSYGNYGGRGIIVCERWAAFPNFLADMGEKPQGKTIDRINPNGNYEPANCRWATKEVQNNNKRTSVFVTIGDRTLTYSQWARELNVDQSVLRARYIKFGTFDPQPRGPRKRLMVSDGSGFVSLRQFCKNNNLNLGTVQTRMYRWPRGVALLYSLLKGCDR